MFLNHDVNFSFFYIVYIDSFPMNKLFMHINILNNCKFSSPPSINLFSVFDMCIHICDFILSSIIGEFTIASTNCNKIR